MTFCVGCVNQHVQSKSDQNGLVEKDSIDIIQLEIESLANTSDGTIIEELSVTADMDGDHVDDHIAVLVSTKNKFTRLLVIGWGSTETAELIYRTDKVEYPTPQKIDVINRQQSLTMFDTSKQAGDVLLIQKLESSSAYLYWNGTEFRSVWVGD